MIDVQSLLVISLWIGVVLLIAIVCKRYFPDKKELTRKIVHIGTGPVIPLAWWLEISKEVVIAFSSFITVCLLINYQARLIPAIEDIERKSLGTIAYGFSITLLIIFFWPQNAAAVTAGFLVMAFGDGFAGLLGKKLKSKKWEILGQTKSVAGTMTMGVVTSIVLISISLIIGSPIYPLKLIGLICLAVILEQISFQGIDNLTVPIGIAIGWTWMSSI